MLIGKKDFDITKGTYVVGILNVTPDSFSDGGKYDKVDSALEQATRMVEEGADIIDIGGESTRPGFTSVSIEQEISRVVPVIEAISSELNVGISIDTTKSEVAEAAIKAGANLVNDVWGFKKDERMAEITAKYELPCCLMHNRDNKEYKDIISDMIVDLQQSIDIALKAGVKKENIILDPGIGFAKTLEQNLEVMRRLEEIVAMGYPVLLGTSRKSMIGLTLNLPVTERIEGTLATTVMGIIKGCRFVRVHDIKENKRACLMTNAMIL